MVTTPPEKKPPFDSNLPNAADLIDNPNIPALDKAGITPDRLAVKLSDLLDATTDKAFKHKSKIITASIPDNKTQLEATKEAHRLRGDYPVEKTTLDLMGEVTLRVVYDETQGEEEGKD